MSHANQGLNCPKAMGGSHVARLPAGFVPSGTKYRKKCIQKAFPCRRYGTISPPAWACSVPTARAMLPRGIIYRYIVPTG